MSDKVTMATEIELKHYSPWHVLVPVQQDCERPLAHRQEAEVSTETRKSEEHVTAHKLT